MSDMDIGTMAVLILGIYIGLEMLALMVLLGFWMVMEMGCGIE